jgi:hypothetical protein
MPSKSAIIKMKAILIIDLIIVAIAAGTYLYLQNQGEFASIALKPATFTVTDLIINPNETNVDTPIAISVKVTNEGDEAGAYSANLTIDDVPSQNKTVQLSSAETTTVEFTIDGTTEGTHSVKIGNLTGTFIVNAPPPPTNGNLKPANIAISTLQISSDEIWPGDSLSITVSTQNLGDLPGNTSVNLFIDNVLTETRAVRLAGGTNVPVRFTITAGSLGTHSVKMTSLGFTLTGSFNVVPSGMHTLKIRTAAAGVEFTVDGQPVKTPYSELLPTGTHTVVMPVTSPDGKFVFQNWDDGSKNPGRTVSLTKAMSFFVYYSGGSSCPSLYIWNGTSYVYVAEVANHGWLGYINYINEDGSIVFWRNNAWDYLKLDKSQLQPRDNNYYDMTLTQRWNEIFYLDAAYMLVVDHPSNVDVYSTAVEQYLDPNFMGKIYTVSKNPLTPISAVNEKGEDVLPQISEVDGIFTPGISGLYSASWDNISWNRLTLDLGDLSDAKQIKLIVRGMVDWGSPDDYGIWLDKFFAQPVPNGTQITPPPYMEVKDANGNWVRVPESRQFPIPPDTKPRTWIVDLTGLFPTNDYSLRINNFWNVTFDYIGVDTSTQENVIIQRINPSASLYQVFNTPSLAAGNFTRYGDVTELVFNEDDKFVIGRQGDEVSLQFPTANIAPPAEGMERDIFIYISSWFKDENGNWGFGFGFTVDPLPFKDMSGFPYPLDIESYPYDAEHLSYLSEYNTRTITAP